jgi:hypothetical protein
MKNVPLKKAKARPAGSVPKRAKRRLGLLRGKIKFHKGWDDPLPDDMLAAFEGRK